MMAGLTVGLWDSLEELSSLWRESAGFQPDYPQEKREKDLARWHEASSAAWGGPASKRARCFPGTTGGGIEWSIWKK